MANTLYDVARKQYLEAGLHWLNDTVKVILVDTGSYAPNFVTHLALSDIPTAARISGVSGVELTGKSTFGGAADANDVTFSAVTGNSIEAIIIYRDTGVEGTSTLMAYIDTATGLPITPNGGDIIVTWDNGVNKIYRL